MVDIVIAVFLVVAVAAMLLTRWENPWRLDR
ncbi:MAG: hypothetical protein PWQ88_897 [Candidatus Methanomethylophilaceae archaeon]|nr:hypothetical protein [Candidatus Methanomethylophilaceae archaeon]MDI3541975.1 hypothetical protein [Candidatus Methanomethylophilaceae archaeon]